MTLTLVFIALTLLLLAGVVLNQADGQTAAGDGHGHGDHGHGGHH